MKAYHCICLLGAACAALLSCKGGEGGAGDGKAPAAGEAPKSYRFEMTHAFTVKVPEGARSVKAWFAMPQRNEPSQKIEDFKVECPHPHQIVKDQHGNEFVNPSSKPNVALCRCGHSGKKPFCDGSHNSCGFVASETAPPPARP